MKLYWVEGKFGEVCYKSSCYKYHCCSI